MIEIYGEEDGVIDTDFTLSVVDAEWTTRDGQKLRFRDMGDRHLGNALNLNRRRARSAEAEIIKISQAIASEPWRGIDLMDQLALQVITHKAYLDAIEKMLGEMKARTERANAARDRRNELIGDQREGGDR